MIVTDVRPWGGPAVDVRIEDGRIAEIRAHRPDGGTDTGVDTDTDTGTEQVLPGRGRLALPTLTLATTQVSVPAGESVEVEVTLDPALVPAAATVSGYLLADVDSEVAARTGWGAVKEDERYALTLRATGLDGEPALAYVGLKERQGNPAPVTVDGEITLRLPAGTYSAMSFMDVVPETGQLGVALVGDPQIELTDDTVVELDARLAEEITAQMPDEGLEPTYRRMEYHVGGGTGMTESYTIPVVVDRLFATPMAGTTDGDFEYLTRWRLRTPLLEITEDGTRLGVIGQSGGAIPDGTDQVLPAVYAGTGTPEEIAAVEAEGAAVVVLRDRSLESWQVGLAAEQAGAAVLVMVNDEPQGFSIWFGTPEGEELEIPVAGISGVEGSALISRVEAGGVQLGLGGGVHSPVVYDVLDPHVDGIPTDLTYAPAPEDLALIESAYHGTQQRLGGEFRYDFRPHTFAGVGFAQYLDTPAVRDEWVSAQAGTQWYQDAELLDDPWAERGIRQGYQPGEQTSESWFSAVVQPRLGEGYWTPNRQGDFLQVNLPSWAGDEPTHTGAMGVFDGTDDQVIRWYDGDTLLSESTGWQSAWLDLVDTSDRHLRVTNDVARDPSWVTSVSSSTEWTFWTQDPGDAWQNFLPFVQVDFAVATDMTGTALAGDEDVIGLTAWNLPGTTGAGEIVEGSLEVSYDSGQTWQQLTLTDPAAAWSAEVVYPRGAEKVSLRGSATDSEGNAVTMEVIDAYLLPEDDDPEPPGEVEVVRIGGVDRYDVAANVAAVYPDGADTVYIASGQGYPDALTGGAAAAQGLTWQPMVTPEGDPAPILLVNSTRNLATNPTLAAIEMLDPSTVIVLGGTISVSDTIVDQLEAVASDATFDRIEGEDRYEVAAGVASMFESPEIVYVASGVDGKLADSLASAATAAVTNSPVVLVRGDHIPAVTAEALDELGADQIILVGGEETITPEIETELGQWAPVTRIGGLDRYVVAANLAAGYSADDVDTVYIGAADNQEKFADSLTGGALAGSGHQPLLLTQYNHLPNVTAATLLDLEPSTVVVFGGTSTITDKVLQDIADLFDDED